MAGIKFGVCALIFREDGKLLTVSRKDKRTEFGMPGGKLDPDETFIEALVREVKEETGLDVVTSQLIFGALSDSKTFYIATYLCTVKTFDTLHTQETINQLGEGDIKWGDWSDIETGFNGSYNRHLHYVVDQIKHDILKDTAKEAQQIQEDFIKEIMSH